MFRKSCLGALLVISFWLLSVGTVNAQFGKNNVRYNQLDQVYESYRFDIWHSLDRSDPVQEELLRQTIANLENARDWMGGQEVFGHNIEKRISILLHEHFTDLES